MTKWIMENWFKILFWIMGLSFSYYFCLFLYNSLYIAGLSIGNSAVIKQALKNGFLNLPFISAFLTLVASTVLLKIISWNCD